MKTQQIHVFEGSRRLQMNESIELTIRSLQAYGPTHKHWAIAWSGGKDSTATLTLVVWLIESGKIQRPETLTVLFADTRLEMVPLMAAAHDIMDNLRELGIDVRVVMAEMDQRYFVYLLGRGVPPPNNGTLRWCTAQIKIEPMEAELRRLVNERFPGREVKAKLRQLIVEASVILKNSGVKAKSLQEGWQRVADPVALLRDTWNWLEEEVEAVRKAAEAPSLSEYVAAVDADLATQKVLMITGVRQGESAMRDARIVMSCGKDGAECGQGWYQETLPVSLCDTLAPLLHWRVCHIWEWLRHWAPRAEYGDWSTEMVAEAYGGDEAEEKNARTGCMGCPLASKDMALENLTKRPQWAYLSPLLRLKPMYRWLRLPQQRLRQPGGEKRKDGSLTANQQRMGPLTMEARLAALDMVLAIQAEVNQVAEAMGRPRVDILNLDEEARIRELIASNTWPNKWTGEEPRADVLLDVMYSDGSVQPLLDFMKSVA